MESSRKCILPFLFARPGSPNRQTLSILFFDSLMSALNGLGNLHPRGGHGAPSFPPVIASIHWFSPNCFAPNSDMGPSYDESFGTPSLLLAEGDYCSRFCGTEVHAGLSGTPCRGGSTKREFPQSPIIDREIQIFEMQANRVVNACSPLGRSIPPVFERFPEPPHHFGRTDQLNNQARKFDIFGGGPSCFWFRSSVQNEVSALNDP